jgi:TPR repeat protein
MTNSQTLEPLHRFTIIGLMKKDLDPAILEQAVSGDVDAQIWLGWVLAKRGQEEEEDARQAEMWFRKAVESGRVDALRAYARFLYDRQRNDVFDIALQLSDRDDFYGHYLLGHLYHHGDLGIKVNTAMSTKYLRVASDQGHLISELDLLRWENVKTPTQWLVRNARFVRVATKLVFQLFRDKSSLTVYR